MVRFVALVVVVALAACGGRVDDGVDSDAGLVADAGPEAVGSCGHRCPQNDFARPTGEYVVRWDEQGPADPLTYVTCCECRRTQYTLYLEDPDACRAVAGAPAFVEDDDCDACPVTPET